MEGWVEVSFGLVVGWASNIERRLVGVLAVFK